jgi:hypothetical protein
VISLNVILEEIKVTGAGRVYGDVNQSSQLAMSYSFIPREQKEAANEHTAGRQRYERYRKLK